MRTGIGRQERKPRTRARKCLRTTCSKITRELEVTLRLGP